MASRMHESRRRPEVRFAKTKLCKFNLQGKCQKGANCSWAHAHTEMETTPDLYRTQLCMALFKTGKCKDNDTCKYAHTQEQLRASPNGRKQPAIHDTQREPGEQKRERPRLVSDPDADIPPPPDTTPPPSPSPAPMWMMTVPTLPVYSGVDMAFVPFPGTPNAGLMPYGFNVSDCNGSQVQYPASQDPSGQDKVSSTQSKVVKRALQGTLSRHSTWSSLEADSLSEASTDAEQSVSASASSDQFSRQVSAFSTPQTLATSFSREGFEISIKNTFLDISPSSRRRAGSAALRSQSESSRIGW